MVIACSSTCDFLEASLVVFREVLDAKTAKALVVREALLLIEDLLIRRARIATDCLRVINTLHDDSKPTYFQITNEIGARGSGRNSCYCRGSRENTALPAVSATNSTAAIVPSREGRPRCR